MDWDKTAKEHDAEYSKIMQEISRLLKCLDEAKAVDHLAIEAMKTALNHGCMTRKKCFKAVRMHLECEALRKE